MINCFGVYTTVVSECFRFFIKAPGNPRICGGFVMNVDADVDGFVEWVLPDKGPLVKFQSILIESTSEKNSSNQL